MAEVKLIREIYPADLFAINEVVSSSVAAYSEWPIVFKAVEANRLRMHSGVDIVDSYEIDGDGPEFAFRTLLETYANTVPATITPHMCADPLYFDRYSSRVLGKPLKTDFDWDEEVKTAFYLQVEPRNIFKPFIPRGLNRELKTANLQPAIAESTAALLIPSLYVIASYRDLTNSKPMIDEHITNVVRKHVGRIRLDKLVLAG